MLFGKHINRYYLRYSPMLLLGVLALILVDYMQLLIPKLYKIVINGLNEGVVEINGEIMPFTMTVLLDEICLPLIFIIISLVVGRFLWRISFFGSANKLEADLRIRMFDHSKDLSQEYYQTNKVGTLMSLFTNDLETVQDCFGSGILMFCDALLLGTLAIIKMAKMNWMLTLFSLIPMSILMFIGTVVGKYMMKKWEVRQEAFSSLSDFSQEIFSGISAIKAFVKEFTELLNFRRLNKHNEKANVDYTRASTILNVSVMLFVESVVCIILGYGSYLVYNGVFNAGELIEFIGYFTTIVWPVMAVSELIEMTSRGNASLKRIGELLDAKIDVCDNENVTDIDFIGGEIEFKNLTFNHPKSETFALENVSFKIEKGENVGIIGRTGSGKTTVVDLILRIYNVPNNTVFIDGHDINTIPIKTVRKFASYVPQDNFLFSDTIENNIAFGVDELNQDEIESVSKMADVHSNISEFQLGYKTILGERGVTVSGGQKQRISIARALMKNASILILDDSVSAVDVKTEKVILENLRNNRKGKTTILIAHRISTIENMDKIIFMENGTVSAVGTHKELYDSNLEYRKMVQLQSLDEEREVSENV